MFETSVIRAHAEPARSRFSVLTVSVIAHTAIIVGAVAVNIASIRFPIAAPDEYSRAPVFATVQIPPPLGTPDGGAKTQTTQPREPKPAPVQTKDVAPSLMPDTPTPVDLSSTTGSSDVTATDGDGSGTEPGPKGVPWGKEGSIGDLDAPPVTVEMPPVEEKIYEAHEVKAPVIVHKVEPRYPQTMIRAAVPATVVVRCIIDKNGNVRDPQVTVSAMPPFNAEVLRAIAQWRFTPGSLNGQAVETYMNLTVRFEVKR